MQAMLLHPGIRPIEARPALSSSGLHVILDLISDLDLYLRWRACMAVIDIISVFDYTLSHLVGLLGSGFTVT